MEINKEKRIRELVDNRIRNFIDKYKDRFLKEVNDPQGVINSKKNNIFVSELGDEFMFYSAFCRSFDSSFGKVLETLANEIAEISYEVDTNRIISYLLPQQTQHIDYLMTSYENREVRPSVSDYGNFNSFIPKNLDSYNKTHVTDNHFYNDVTKEHYIIELKAGGDLDNKKARSEKISLLHQYFILKNLLEGTDETVKIYLATAYNMYGEGNDWKQERVKQYFGDDELLIGKDYWNFVCDDENGFDIIYDQYKTSSKYILSALDEIKKKYFNN